MMKLKKYLKKNPIVMDKKKGSIARASGHETIHVLGFYFFLFFLRGGVVYSKSPAT